MSNAWTEGFNVRPRTDRADLENYHEGLIVLSGGLDSEIFSHLTNDDTKEAEKTINWYKRTFADDFYIELRRYADLFTNGSQLQRINERLIEKGVKTWRVVAVFPVGRAAEDPDIRNHFFACLAGVTVGSVLVDGSISACPSIRSNFHQGNIYDDDFMDIWLNKFEPYRNREWMRKGECAECKYFRYCRGSGMHLRDDSGNLIVCPLHRLQ